MDSRLLRRPVIDLLSGRSQCLLSPLNATSRRHESSYRRTRHRLNIKPESSFLQSKESPTRDHIIFNPPAAAPSVFHTPIKFLPKEDKRRQLLAATAARVNGTNPILPPEMRTQKIPHHHLSQEDVATIQSLNRKEPNVWTNTKLAKKFNCSSTFISICLSQAGGDTSIRKAEMQAKWEAIKARWGPRRLKAREDAQKRYEAAYRGD